MSMYQYAAMQGASAVATAALGSNAESDAWFNKTYSTITNKLNAREAKHTASLNISAIKQDTVLTNTKIELQQAQAKAAAVVSAAAAGAEGGSVDDVMYEADKSAAFAKSSRVQQEEQEVENIFGQMSGLNESQFRLEEPSMDLAAVLTGVVGSIDQSDFDRWGLSLDEDGEG